jgi:hypothetical protein
LCAASSLLEAHSAWIRVFKFYYDLVVRTSEIFHLRVYSEQK